MNGSFTHGAARLGLALALFLGWSAALTGCAEIPLQQPDKPMGAAVKGVMAKQVLNQQPAAVGPVEGLDGKRVQKAMEAYRNPEAESKSTNTYSINFGAPAAGSAQAK